MPRISEPFVLTNLSYSSDKETASLVRAATTSSSSVFLGISHSCINSYSLLPTPRLLWSYSIPPGSLVTGLETFNGKSVCFAVHERKKYALKLVQAEEDSSITTENSNNLTQSWEVPGEVGGLGFSSTGERVYAVLRNSCIYAYPANGTNEKKELWSSKTKASRTLVHCSFIPPAALDTTTEENGPEDGSVVLVSTRDVGRKSLIEVRVLALEARGSYELISKEIEVPEQDIKSGLVLTYRDGVLYRYSSEHNKVYATSILNDNHATVFSVPRSVNSNGNGISTLMAIGKQNLFLSDGNSVILIDTKYQTVVAHRTLSNPLTSTLGFVESSSTVLGVSITATTARSQSVVGINVDIGKGTLLESIGKGVGEEEDPWRLGYCDILIKKSYNLREYSGVIKDVIATAQESAIGIIETLSQYKEKNDITTFEDKAIEYLTGQEWEEDNDHNSGDNNNDNSSAKKANGKLVAGVNGTAGRDIDANNSTNETGEENALAYEDKDRDVDREFIFELVDMIFDNASPNLLAESETAELGNNEGLKLSSRFVPEKLIIYLLTHPLFPTPELPGLLNALSEYPRLLRQAIVTAPSIECFDLVDALSHTDNEIFRDIVNRILEEFGQDEIFESIKLKYGNGSTTNNSKETLAIINRLINLDIGWPLIPCFVDVGGLFGWDHSVISSLYKTVTSQVEALVSSSEIMTLIDETLRKFDNTLDLAELGRRSRKATANKLINDRSSRRGPELISSEQREQDRMKNLLKFGVGDVSNEITGPDPSISKKKKAIKQANLISRRVPAYTVEKLIL